jgi:hypothetical protein
MKGNSVLLMSGLSRRAALRHAAALGAVIGLGGGLRRVAAQDSATEMANHPMVGTWLGGRTPDSLGTTRFGPDGSMTNTAGVIGQTPEGALALNSLDLGVWEPVSAREIHFTFTETNYDATGKVLGTTTVDGYPVASEDGESFWDDGTNVTITIRDPSGAVTQVLGPGLTDAGIGGVRMRPGKPGYDEMLAMLTAQAAATQEPGTPTI